MKLATLLRYNTRHHLFFPGDGLRPQLNPISSWSHARKSRKRTKSWHEPLWAFRLRQRWFAFAGHQRCGRRDDAFSMNRSDGPQPDTWDWGPDGNRTCSYCGSIHPDDLIKICHLTLKDERYGVEGTDKGYKVYVKQPGVRNASEGAIKFYMQHAPQTPRDDDQRLFKEASRLTRERFEARYNVRNVGT
jgi:hypothetical protein